MTLPPILGATSPADRTAPGHPPLRGRVPGARNRLARRARGDPLLQRLAHGVSVAQVPGPGQERLPQLALDAVGAGFGVSCFLRSPGRATARAQPAPAGDP